MILRTFHWRPPVYPIPQTRRRMLRHKAVEASQAMLKSGWRKCVDGIPTGLKASQHCGALNAAADEGLRLISLNCFWSDNRLGCIWNLTALLNQHLLFAVIWKFPITPMTIYLLLTYKPVHVTATSHLVTPMCFWLL